MLFNSLQFAGFFAIVYTLYRLLPFAGQNMLLLAAGYIFYGCWDVRFLFLIALSTTIDFTIGVLLSEGRLTGRQRAAVSAFPILAALLFLCPDWSAPGLVLTSIGPKVLTAVITIVVAFNLSVGDLAGMSKARRRKLLITLSVVANLGILAFFKYCDFFVDSAAAALTSLGLDADRFHLHIVLPVGISFYTFQSLSYTIDVYRGRTLAVSRFRDFALFVAYFPPMVAGPIERARHLLPQLINPRRIRLDQSTHGLVLILMGLFKKIAIADGVAPAVSTIFLWGAPPSQAGIAFATLMFTVQIFCDFSGYSDIARGVSKLLGIELMVNFNLPYFSRNPSEFWRRWHISLSSWLRDYLYVPLGGNRRGKARTYLNLFLTMLLGGLWHGAAWTYVLWGAYHGVLLGVHRAATGRRHTLPTSDEAIAGTPVTAPARRWPTMISTPFRIAALMLAVCYGWLLFRATSFDQIVRFTAILLGLKPGAATPLPSVSIAAWAGMALLGILQLIDYRAGRLESFLRWRPAAQGLLYAVVTLILIMGLTNAPAQFIYFQF